MDKFEAIFIALLAIVVAGLTTFLSVFFITTSIGALTTRSSTMASSSQPGPDAAAAAPPGSDGPEQRNVLGKLKLGIFRRKRQRIPDEEEAIVHPPVFCVEDLEVPPPTYQRARCSTPSSLEISTLKEQLGTLKQMRVAAFEPFEKTLHNAEIVNLHQWIQQLENLARRKATRAAASATTSADEQTATPSPGSGD